MCSGCQCTSASWNLRATVQKEATVLVLRAKQAAANFLLSMHRYGRSFLLFYMQSRIYACKFLFAGFKIYARKYYNYTESTKYVYPIVGLNTKYRTSIFSFRCLFGLSNWVVRFVAKKSPFDSKERKAGVTRTALCTGQVIKKKDAPCLGPRYRSARQSPVQNISAGNGPRWRLKLSNQRNIFFAQI